MVLLLPIVYGATWDMCSDTVEINTNCSMVTPILSCSVYNYSIINTTGDLIRNGSLTNLDGDVYYFNFTETEGDYLVVLCDDTTREVMVKEDENMFPIAIIILLPMLLGFIFLIGSATLGENHSAIKIFLFLLSIVMFFMSMGFGLLTIIHYYNFDDMEDSIGTMMWVTGFIFFIIVSYFLMYAFDRMVRKSAQDKEDELKY